MDSVPEISILKFADSRVPEFKEVRNKDYVYYGEKNLYPEYLTYLYNKSAKHGAIINGKCNYIYGGGLISESQEVLTPVNKEGETLNDLIKKSVLDCEIYGGFRWFVVWDRVRRLHSIHHVEFNKIRTGKDGSTYFYKNDWADSRDKEILEFNEFNEKYPVGVQIYAYNEYRPGCGVYPLPGYLACNNYIETDIEISKYNLSCITNGMMPSKLVQVYTGGDKVTDEMKKVQEKKFLDRFTGSEKGGSVLLAWSANRDRNIEIEDLSSTDSDKLFEILNKTCQQEIFTGHGVVSPMLFGIKTEGQLGGTNELRIAHEIFINTYAKPKQDELEKVANDFDRLRGGKGDLRFEQMDPIGLIIPDSLLESALKPEEVRERIGLPPLEVVEVGASQKILDALSSVSPLVATKILDNLTRNEIRGLATLPPIPDGDTIPAPEIAGGTPDTQESETSINVNDNIKNLTGKQHQQLKRIIREYSKGILTLEAATALLKTGLGLSDEDISSLLGINIQTEKMSSALSETEVAALFEEHGNSRSDFHLVKKKAVKFSNDDDALEDELLFFTQAFKGTEVEDHDVLRLIEKDKRITPEVIADVLKVTPEKIINKISSLIKRGLLITKEVAVGSDIEIERKLAKPLKEIIPTKEEGRTEVLIKYSYEGPKDDRNRPFCKKLLELDRLYSRYEIEIISQKVGYSVFDRRGGFWRKPDGTVSPSCRHNWMSNIVIRKGGSK